jgi:hypothetical protein
MFLTQPAEAKPIRIVNDSGGYVVDYIQRSKKADRIIIDGKCYSACTIYLGHPRVCVTRRARLGFHAPYGGTDAINEAFRLYMLGQYPPQIRKWIDRKGGLNGRLLYLSGKELRGKVKQCRT